MVLNYNRIKDGDLWMGRVRDKTIIDAPITQNGKNWMAVIGKDDSKYGIHREFVRKGFKGVGYLVHDLRVGLTIEFGTNQFDEYSHYIMDDRYIRYRIFGIIRKLNHECIEIELYKNYKDVFEKRDIEKQKTMFDF